jgi:hypothetical protein
MPGPWENFSPSAAAPAAGPWANYESGAASAPDAAQPSIVSDALKYSPVGMVQGLASMIRTAASGNNPFAGMAEANVKILDKAKASFSDGHYADAAAHFANYLNPLGGAFEDVSQDLSDGNYGHAAAKFTGLLSNAAVPAALDAATAPGAGSSLARIPGAIGAGVKAAAPDVAAGLGKVAGGELLAKLPGMEFPARIGLGYPGARQMGKGIGAGFDAARAAMADQPVAVPAAGAPAADAIAAAKAAFQQRLDARMAEAFPERDPAAPLPPEYATNSRGLPAAQLAAPASAIPMPPASMEHDPSFVRGVPGEYATVEGKAQAAPPQPAPEVANAGAERAQLLDDIAAGQLGKKYKNLSVADQGKVQFLADQIQASEAAKSVVWTPAPSPAEPAPQEAPEAPPSAPVAQTPMPAPGTPPISDAQRFEDAQTEALAQRRMRDQDAEWGNRTRLADKFSKQLAAQKLDPTPENIARLARTMGQRELPSADTVDMIHDRMKYTQPGKKSFPALVVLDHDSLTLPPAKP